MNCSPISTNLTKQNIQHITYHSVFHSGPELLKFLPGQKAGDLKIWLQAYRYWNQGGIKNAAAMLQLLQRYYRNSNGDKNALSDLDNLPDLEVTPDIGLLHPLLCYKDGSRNFFTSPKDYLGWRESQMCSDAATEQNFVLANKDAPRVAILLYRKHVITNQRYICDLIKIMEEQGIFPVRTRINSITLSCFREYLTDCFLYMCLFHNVDPNIYQWR